MTNADGSRSSKKSVFLVQQGVWQMSLESLPLACGYLKATALADDRIRETTEIVIHNFGGGATNARMANAMFSSGPPDILALSVFGWNYRSAGELATTFKQLNPDGWVVAGGTHVDNQADRVFRMFPDIDVVVNGEGELTFRDLLNAYLDGTPKDRLHHIAGISFQGSDGAVITNTRRGRIEDLEVIPSPFLTGALELTDANGKFRYDVALLETNRGCPYKCSFCYWGGAVGQKVRAFSIDRLRRELELFAKLKLHNVLLCDANFGLLPGDVEFMKALIEIREKYGFPQALHTSYAKNKSKLFYQIVKMMKDAGMRPDFVLALQTLSDEALKRMNRSNMKLNDFDDLVAWLNREGFDIYAELIWGAPGETVESFMEGYDRLARHVSRIATYPLMLLPNTDYKDKKELFGIKSIRGDTDDFEYVLAHDTMTFEENQRMQLFLIWARTFAEMAAFRYIWAPLRVLAGMTQSQVLRNFQAWIAEVDDPAAVPLRSMALSGMDGTGSYGAWRSATEFVYTEPEARRLLNRWWNESIRPLLPIERVALLNEVFRYDLLTQPVYNPRDAEAPQDELPVVDVRGVDYYVRSNVELTYDVPRIAEAMRAERATDLEPSPCTVDLYYLLGSEAAIGSADGLLIIDFMGKTQDEVLGRVRSGISATEMDEYATLSAIGEPGRASGKQLPSVL